MGAGLSWKSLLAGLNAEQQGQSRAVTRHSGPTWYFRYVGTDQAAVALGGCGVTTVLGSISQA